MDVSTLIELGTAVVRLVLNVLTGLGPLAVLS